MNGTELFCSGFLLSAIGILGTALGSARSAVEETPSHTDADISTPSDIETWRAIHRVALLDEKAEGFGVARLPNAVYGFSWSPQEESPLYRKQRYQSFEVHIDAEGEVHILGYVTAEAAAMLGKGTADCEMMLYPETYGDATQLVSIQRSRILSHKAPARDNGNPLKLKLRAVKSFLE